MTIVGKLRAAFVARWIKPTVKDAASILSKHARMTRSKYDQIHDRLRAERDAGWPGVSR